MPRAETRYYCEICGKYYMKKELAIECEKTHLIPECISDAEYLSGDRKNRYPDSVLIHFKDGITARYYRKQK